MEKRSFYLAIASMLVISLFAVGTSLAKDDGNDNRQLTDKQAKIITLGILSPNTGISHTCIYYSGKYKVYQSVDMLVGILKDPKCDSYTRTLAALSLGRIGNASSINAIKEITSGDKDSKVKSVCEMIYKEFHDFNELPLTAKN